MQDDVDADGEDDGGVKTAGGSGGGPSNSERAARILKTLRHAASGVPAMFKDPTPRDEEDIELGQDLLDKGGDKSDDTKEALTEIKIDDAKVKECWYDRP